MQTHKEIKIFNQRIKKYLYLHAVSLTKKYYLCMLYF